MPYTRLTTAIDMMTPVRLRMECSRTTRVSRSDHEPRRASHGAQALAGCAQGLIILGETEAHHGMTPAGAR